MKRRELHMLTVGLGLMLFLLPACAPAPTPDRTRFTTTDEAAKALMKGLKTNNAEELKAIFGPSVEKDLSSGDPVSDLKTARRSRSPWRSPGDGRRLAPTGWS